MEKPVTFKNRKGETLFGMLFIPDNEDTEKKVGIILSVDAVKYRIGTFRLHTLLAREWCRSGYHVMYFDPAGIGDSEGYFEEKYVIEHHLDIARGKYNEDTLDAVSFFKSQFPLDSMLLFGLCGGAVSVTISAGLDPRIDGLILLAVPVLFDDVRKIDGDTEDHVSIITTGGYARNVLKTVFKKVFSPQSWIKLVKLKINWREIYRVSSKALRVAIKDTQQKISGILRKKKRIAGSDPVSEHPRFNRLFQESLFRFFSRGKKILFIFGELDFVTWDFKSEFQDKALSPGNPYEGLYEIHMIKDANHIFAGKEAYRKINGIIRDWLSGNFSF